MTEVELAEKFINYLQDSGEIYCEVETNGFIDIVVLNDDVLTSVEVKNVFNLKVIEQAVNNKKYTHYSYVAVPNGKDIKFRCTICREFGIGVILYNKKTGHIHEYVKPKLNKPKHKLKLLDINKKAVAGCQHGRVTLFQNTINNIVDILNKNGGSMLIDMLLKEVTHHYCNDNTAKSSLKKWVRKGVISNFYFDGKKIILN